jgi:hypothetical protein
MVSVATGEAAQNFLRQKPFPPNRHQSLRIQVSRVEGPKSHEFIVDNAAFKFKITLNIHLLLWFL